MGTRAQIGIFEKEDIPNSSIEVLLYRHYDGMPSRVIPEIKPFLNEFNRLRGINDTHYCIVRLAQHLTNLQNKMQKEMGLPEENDAKFRGYGLFCSFAYDIEYFYHVSPTAIKVYLVNSQNPNDWPLVKRLKLSTSKRKQGVK